MIKPFEWIIHYLAKGLITMEERAFYAEEARRLKIKTDLQETRIQKLLKAKEEKEQAAKNKKDYFTLVAVAKHRHAKKIHGVYVSVHSIYYLERNTETKRRQVRGGNCCLASNGQVVSKAQISDFFESQEIWYLKLKPWLDGTKSLADIECDEIILTGAK